MIFRISVIAGGLALLVCTASATTRSFSQESFEHFVDGQMQNVSLGSTGFLQPAPRVELLHELDEDPLVWKAATASDGTLYLATGPEGRIWKIAPGAEPEMVFDPKEVLVRALTVAPDGSVYVGASPQGVVYKLNPDSETGADVFFESGQSYVWDLLADDEGNLYVAAGYDAKVFKVSPDGEGEDIFAAAESHVSALAMLESGTLLAGTTPGGYLYQINGDGTGYALFSSDEQEIKRIAPLPNGGAVFTTFTESDSRSALLPTPPSNERNQNGNGNGDESGRDDDNNSRNQQPTVVIGGVSTNSRIYFVSPDGLTERFWTSTQGNIHDFVPTPDGAWLLGLSDQNRLMRVADRDNWSHLLEVPEGGEISVLLEDSHPDGLALAVTSHPARVYRIYEERSDEAVYTSEIFDAGVPGIWGRFEAITAGSDFGTSIDVRVGNTANPDDTWSSWRPLKGQPSNGMIAAPPGRYLQYRVSFFSTTAGMHKIRGFYRVQNSTPVINSIKVVPVNLQVTSSVSNNSTVDINKLFSGDPRQAIDNNRTRQVLRGNREPGVMTVVWRTADVNEDTLFFDVEMRHENDEDWFVIGRDITQSFASLQTQGLKEGFYQVRLHCRDRYERDHPDVRTATRESVLFLIDNAGPSLEAAPRSARGKGVSYEIRATDTRSVISAARYALNGGDWVVMEPGDRIYDNREEAFPLQLDQLDEGRHSLIVEAYDENGNPGSIALSFSVE